MKILLANGTEKFESLLYHVIYDGSTEYVELMLEKCFHIFITPELIDNFIKIKINDKVLHCLFYFTETSY